MKERTKNRMSKLAMGIFWVIWVIYGLYLIYLFPFLDNKIVTSDESSTDIALWIFSGEFGTGIAFWIFSGIIILSWSISFCISLFEIAELNAKYEAREEELLQQLESTKTLPEIIPICANCKNIRKEDESWEQIEQYISDRTNVCFSHGICPKCIKILYPTYDAEV